MADDLKDLLDEEGRTKDGQADTKDDHKDPPHDRTSTRINTLLEKLKTVSDERDQAVKARAEAEFRLGFKDQTQKYPLAKEHEAEIKDLTEKNSLSVEDASILTLRKHDKLVTKEDLDKQKAKDQSVGGSADTKNLPPSGQKEPKDMTQEERLAALKEAEAKGELGVE